MTSTDPAQTSADIASEPEYLHGPSLELDPTFPALIYHPKAAVQADSLNHEAFRDLKDMSLMEGMTTRGTFGRIPMRDRIFITHFEHERDHMLRAVGTTFGILLWGVRQLRVGSAGQLFKNTASDGYFPLYRPASLQQFLATYQNNPTSLQDNIREMPAAERSQVLFGLSDHLMAALMRNARSADLWPALGLLTSILGPNAAASVTETFGAYAGGYPLSSPVVTGFEERPLCTADLFEYLAVRHQLNIAALTAASSDEAFEVLRQRVAEQRQDWSEYRFVETLWERLRPDGFFGKEVIREGSASLRGIWRAYPIEMLAAIDLSLWVPLGPQGAVGVDGCTWLDLSPAWRFIRTAVSLAKSGAPMNMLPKTGGADLFLSLQASWCKEFGWPTPERLCSGWLDAIKARTVESVEFSDNARWRLTRNILEQRMIDPISTAISIDYEHRPGEFPLVVRPVRGTWERFGESETISKWLVSEALIKAARRRTFPQFRSPEEARAVGATLAEGVLPSPHSEEMLKALARYLSA